MSSIRGTNSISFGFYNHPYFEGIKAIVKIGLQKIVLLKKIF